MPRKKKTEEGNSLDTSLLQPDATAKGAPRIAGMSEIGYSGLKVIDKQIMEDADKDWRMPARIKTVDAMCTDGAIAAAIQFYIVMLGRVDWTVKPPLNATPTQIERAKAISTMMGDMSHSWNSFIVSLLSCMKYGFSVHEKVFKRRVKGNSKYDDGVIGWDSLPSRAQSTLDGWEFTPDGRNLTAFLQTLQNIQYGTRYSSIVNNAEPIRIPREKFLLFRTSPINDNPEGSPALKSAYKAWKYKKFVEEEECKGLGRDLGGLLHITMPAAFMSPDADYAKKATYEEYKRAARNVAAGEQGCLITPSDADENTKTKMFDVELLTSQGSRGYDTNKIIQRYTSNMLVSLFADLLQLGNDATGSFALAGSKQDIIQYALEFRLKEIRDVLNFDLIPSTFAQNRWDDTDYPTFEFGSLSSPDIEAVSKYLQRTAATGSIEIDRELLNYSRSILGLDPKPDDEPPNTPTATSRSGDGMAKGSGNGTSDKVAGSDNSANNMDNKA